MTTATATGQATAGATAGATAINPPYLNPTSRLHKWICSCPDHIVRDAIIDPLTQAVIKREIRKGGPYVIRVAGTGLLATCNYCGDCFRLEDAPPTRRLYRGCEHCENPEAHAHGKACAGCGHLVTEHGTNGCSVSDSDGNGTACGCDWVP